MLTLDQLKQIFSKAPAARLTKYEPLLRKALEEAQINTPLRIAAFLAQIGHESYELRYMEEVWGPTAQQLRYDPPTTLAKKLGNTEPGDGKKFSGAGPLQITGRANFREYGQALGLDLENNPDLARTPEVGFRLACLYWKKKGLNTLADLGTQEAFDKITLKINGGYNGKAHRDAYWLRARKVLGC